MPDRRARPPGPAAGYCPCAGWPAKLPPESGEAALRFPLRISDLFQRGKDGVEFVVGSAERLLQVEQKGGLHGLLNLGLISLHDRDVLLHHATAPLLRLVGVHRLADGAEIRKRLLDELRQPGLVERRIVQVGHERFQFLLDVILRWRRRCCGGLLVGLIVAGVGIGVLGRLRLTKGARTPPAITKLHAIKPSFFDRFMASPFEMASTGYCTRQLKPNSAMLGIIA